MSDDMILIRLQIFKDRRLKHRHCMKILRGDDGLFYHTDCASLHYWWKFMAFGNFFFQHSFEPQRWSQHWAELKAPLWARRVWAAAFLMITLVTSKTLLKIFLAFYINLMFHLQRVQLTLRPHTKSYWVEVMMMMSDSETEDVTRSVFI